MNRLYFGNDFRIIAMTKKKYNQPITIFLDQDGPLADFGRAAELAGLSPQDAKMLPGFYRNLPPTPGALAAVKELHTWPGVQVFVATKIPDRNPLAATEKIQWLHEHIPDLEERIIITPNKGCLGKPGDVLVDDRKHKADAAYFPGLFIHFGTSPWDSWEQVMMTLQEHCRR
jgi:5'-nucleotidase